MYKITWKIIEPSIHCFHVYKFNDFVLEYLFISFICLLWANIITILSRLFIIDFLIFQFFFLLSERTKKDILNESLNW